MKWADFKRKYPNYTRYRFDENYVGNVVFKFNGDNYNPFYDDGTLKKTLYHFPSSNGHIKTENINDFLGKPAFEKATTEFPKNYRLNKNANYNFLSWKSYPSHLNYYSFDIYITPNDKTNFTFRNIFDDSGFKLKKMTDIRKWVESPNLSFWNQSLNFAVWCATGGCGVSREMFREEVSQINSFYKFHVYFTIRRILNELQCPLPKDKHFSKINNFYNKNAFEKLKTEFSTPNDFRYRGSSELHYFKSDNPGKPKFDPWTYEPIEKSVSDPKMKHSYDYFFPYDPDGLTKAGLSRINQSIEAFVYCILGSQVQTRSSIIGGSGSAEETKKVFLQLFESSVIESDISKSIQRYQFALQQAKQKTRSCRCARVLALSIIFSFK